MGTLALTGRASLQAPYGPYLAEHAHIPPTDGPEDPTGEAALASLDRVLGDVGPGSVAAFFCEPIAAAALPAAGWPDGFWEGLAERRERHGFLVCFDEVVTGMGRVGDWLAAHRLPIEPDIVTIGKGLGAGYAPVGAVLCRQHVYDALDGGSGGFDLGHTWDGAPLPMGVGLAVLDVLQERRLVESVHERGPSLRDQLASALDDVEIVGEVRGRGFLLGVELVDPRDGASPLPVELDAAAALEASALDHGVLVTATHPQADGFAGDQLLLAPAFTSTDEELAEMIDRVTASVRDVARTVTDHLSRPTSGTSR
jgi:adenosylmethionine-8-amino-7-oxononanoate aminotransferase